MLIDRTEEDGYFLGEVVPENLPKLIAKLETEDFAIIQSTTKNIRKEVINMGYRCYILSLKCIEDNSSEYSTLILKNNQIQTPGEPFADLRCVSSFPLNKSILVAPGEYWALSGDGTRSKFTKTDKTNDIVTNLEQCYSDILDDGRTFKLEGVKSPINNLSRMAMSTLNICWM